MLVSLIICTYKRPLLLKTCLTCALEVAKHINCEIIVINDCIDDKIIIPKSDIIFPYNNTSNGLASARNLGVQKAKGDLVLMIDDDIEFTTENVKQLINLHFKYPEACFNPNWKYSEEMNKIIEKKQFGRFLIHVGLVNYKGWVKDLDWQDTVFSTPKLAGFFMLMPKKIFEKTTGFNEEFIKQGIEDDVFSFRLRQLNIKLFIDPANYVFHNELDRIELEQRLVRYYNGAINRRKAFELGYKEYEIKYTNNKLILLKIASPFTETIITLTKLIPNKILFDSLYFKLSHLLIALAIYKGYSKVRK